MEESPWCGFGPIFVQRTEIEIVVFFKTKTTSRKDLYGSATNPYHRTIWKQTFFLAQIRFPRGLNKDFGKTALLSGI